MLCHEGVVSVIGFIATAVLTFLVSVLLFFVYNLSIAPIENTLIYFGCALVIYIVVCIVSYEISTSNDFQIIVRASILGVLFGFGIVLAFGPSAWTHFGAYITVMSLFHYSEFLAIAWANPCTLSTDTFMLMHSAAYGLAAVTSWIEFSIEAFYYPQLKDNLHVMLLGVAICLAGEILRKMAIITATSNFNHLVQYQKAKDHSLVTHGVYAYMRHPSYGGWFWWSIGTQVVLCNPLCIIFYAIASWKFFQERILIEEITLVNFFQQEYVDYQKRVGTGVPFIRGYVHYEPVSTSSD